MFLSWFDLAHHDPEPSVEGSGVQSEIAPGFHFDRLSVASPVEPPLKACANDGVHGVGGNYEIHPNSRSSSLARVVSSGRFSFPCLSATGHGFGGSHRLLRRSHSHFPAGRGGAPARLHA